MVDVRISELPAKEAAMGTGDQLEINNAGTSQKITGQEVIDGMPNAAPAGADGFMTGADKTKIDSVDSNANDYTHPDHTGDVTSTADGATVIVDEAVTLAKMADMATASLLGRVTVPEGVPEVLSKATALSLLNVEDGADVTDATNVATAGAPLLSSDNAFSGINTNSAQPAFLVTNSVTDINVTGSTLVATVEFDTEIFDQGSDFNNVTDTFTAPVNGKYLLTTHVRINDVVSASQIIFQLNTSNRNFRIIEVATGATNDWSAKYFAISMIADMDADDTSTVTVNIDGMTGDDADIAGHVTFIDTGFSGALLA